MSCYSGNILYFFVNLSSHWTNIVDFCVRAVKIVTLDYTPLPTKKRRSNYITFQDILNYMEAHKTYKEMTMRSKIETN